MKLEKNASACMKALPFWIIPYMFYFYYLSLFLGERGISEAQITVLMSVQNISSLFCSFLAAPIVDRLGRKRSLLYFDIFSSSVPALICYFSQNYWMLILAWAILGMSRIMNTAYYLILIEDTSDDNSMNAMNMFNIINVVAGLLIPVAGIIITRMGLVEGERLLLLTSAILMTVQAVIRHFFIDETPTGKAVMQRREKKERTNLFATYKGTLKYIFANREVLSALIINALIYVYYGIGTTTSMLFTPYFSDYRNLTGIALSSIGAVYSGGTLFSMLVINPRVNKGNIYKFTIVSALASIGGFVLILVCPQGNTVLLFAAIVMLALSYGILKSAADGLLAMETEGEFGSGIYSISFVASALLSVVALKAVGILYEISPNWMFGLSLILITAVLLDCLIHQRRKKNAEL